MVEAATCQSTVNKGFAVAIGFK